MYKLGSKKKIGKKTSHRHAMINNQLRSLLVSSKVETTTAKAKVLKANAESYFTKVMRMGKKDLETYVSKLVPAEDRRKELLKYIASTPVVKIVKIRYRAGDNAEVSKVYLDGYNPKRVVSKKGQPAKQTKKEEKREDGEQAMESRAEKRSERAKTVRSVEDKAIGKQRARTRSGL